MLRAPPDVLLDCTIFSLDMGALLAGPTGMGKTEISKQLAITMGIQLSRFDMPSLNSMRWIRRPFST